MKSLNNSFLSGNRMEIRQMAVELFAASLLEVIPKTLLVKTEATPLGFYCESISPLPFTQEYQEIVLERARNKIKNLPPYRVMEMVSTNAKDYMQHIRQPYRKKSIDSSQQFTPVIQIEDYANPLEGPVCEEIGAISIEDVTMEGEVLKVVGFAQESKEALKEHRKIVKNHRKFDHLKLGKEQKLFVIGSDIIWLKKGVESRRELALEIGKKLESLNIGEVFFEGDMEPEQEKWFKYSLRSSLGDMGVKDAPRQLMIEGKGDISNLAIGEWRGDFCYCRDGYGIDWIVAEAKKNFKIYLDTLFALQLEEKGKKGY